MPKRTLLVAGISVALTAALAAPFLPGRSYTLCSGFLPPNSMQIPAKGQNRWGTLSMRPNGAQGGISEATYNDVLDEAQRIYGPIVKAHGGHLVINRLWDNAVVNSDTRRSGSDWILDIDGGIARYQSMTRESFTLVVCHELGHNLGGFPKENGLLSKIVHGTWASNEGEADYYATLKCLPRMLAGQSPAGIDKTVAKSCAHVYGQQSGDAQQCAEDAMAAAPLVELFQELGHTAPASFATPSQKKVFWIANGHPEPQCRLDTYFQGALCKQPITALLSNTDPAPGACTAPAFSVGLRPACWFSSIPNIWSVAASKPPKLPSGQAVGARVQSVTGALINN